MNGHIAGCIEQHINVVQMLKECCADWIGESAGTVIGAIRRDGTIFWCGNSGSAADSQHLAAELIGRFKRERVAIASIALTTDTSALTAVGNDYSYGEIFKRQVEGLVRRGTF